MNGICIHVKFWALFSCRQDAMAMGGQTRLQLGCFTISPAMYTVSPGSTQTVTVRE